ncbi:hypothetical protein [Halalkalibacterium halodurans]|uniref:hypothetical protein n=1 Tax=Halalkalibacterium halodurans TaxID=86665 RepID=UPI002AA9F59C|nr:hypothetical protein [Halalkalibacterium halodurans]MDY7222097.1 hypothetical protein [Halalkalibacterium halodurans]MDY7243884.1 hypothetical protein [Halalkalibacterium halodurans]
MNDVAKALYVIGWLTIIGGLVLGFANREIEVEGLVYSHTETSWAIFFIYFVGGIISGVIMFGFAEIVNLLDKIYRSLNGNSDDTSEAQEEAS